jgi:hypothetical protein
MVNLQSSLAFPSARREPLARHESAARVRGAASDRLGNQETVWFTSDTSSVRLAGLRVRIP